MFNLHPRYNPEFAPNDFQAFLHLKKFLSGQHQRFQNDREAEMGVTQWFQSPAAHFYDRGYISWSHDMTNASISEVNILKNSSSLAFSINLSIKLGFVSVKGYRDIYSVDALCRT